MRAGPARAPPPRLAVESATREAPYPAGRYDADAARAYFRKRPLEARVLLAFEIHIDGNTMCTIWSLKVS